MVIRYFAWLKDYTGCAQEQILCPDNVQTIDGLMTYLAARSDDFAKAFSDRAVIRAAINHEFAQHDAVIKYNDEVASLLHMVKIGEYPILLHIINHYKNNIPKIFEIIYKYQL